MRKVSWSRGTIIFLLAFFLLLPAALSGLILTTGDVSLKAGETKRVCKFWVYNTFDKEATFTISVTGEAARFVKSIEPKEILVRPLNEVCPRENGSARRECLLEFCRQANYTYCGGTCITFSAPLVFSWKPSWITYKGGITSSAQLGVAKIIDALPFNVNLMPISYLTPLTGIGLLILVVGVIVISKRKKRRKFVKKKRRKR